MSPRGFDPSSPSSDKPFSIVLIGISDLANTFDLLLLKSSTSLIFISPKSSPRKLASILLTVPTSSFISSNLNVPLDLILLVIGPVSVSQDLT